MKFLVAGSSLPETVIQDETGRMRRHIGGVAAIMARELAQAGADVTLVVNAIPGEPAQEIISAVEKLGMHTVLIEGYPKPNKRASAAITVRNGNPVRFNGNWNRTGYMGPQFSSLCREHDWLLTGLSLDIRDLQSALGNCANVAVNATTARSAPKALRLKGQRILTMNQRECESILYSAKATDRENQLTSIAGAETVMVTAGSKGRRIHRAGEAVLSAKAVPVPKGTDFIGAGDAATAGLVYAQAQGLDLNETIDEFITCLLERNASAYR